MMPQAVVVVVGCGVAGLMAAYEAGTLGANVVLVDKAAKGGGNSVKASSGISGASSLEQTHDFFTDTINGGGGNPELVRKLTEDSPEILKQLTDLGVNLPKNLQLGGHTSARTWAPADQPVGNYLFRTLETAIANDFPAHEFMFGHRLLEVSRNVFETGEPGSVTGVELETPSGARVHVDADSVVIATGGFAGSAEALSAHCPSPPAKFSTTNGPQATGDGLEAAVLAGASVVEMDQVQFHPTAFVDPNDPEAPSKILCPEAFRGAGGVMLDPATGRRFVDELGRRDVVSAAIGALEGGEADLVLSPLVAAKLPLTDPNGFYSKRGLLRRVPYQDLPEAFRLEEVPEYDALALAAAATASSSSSQPASSNASEGADAPPSVVCPRTGKRFFPSNIGPLPTQPSNESPHLSDNNYVVAKVRPAAHYCMGGLRIDSHAQVLDAEGKLIPGLFAAGEVTGGVHGSNRLGGNSLMDCAVFGKEAGRGAATWARGA